MAKNTNFLSISKKKTRTGKHSLLFDVTKDKNPTTRTVQTTFEEQTRGILESWFLDSPAMRPSQLYSSDWWRQYLRY